MKLYQIEMRNQDGWKSKLPASREQAISQYFTERINNDLKKTKYVM